MEDGRVSRSDRITDTIMKEGSIIPKETILTAAAKEVGRDRQFSQYTDESNVVECHNERLSNMMYDDVPSVVRHTNVSNIRW